jgi:NTP pyrophosphatase (non-canonical NTP hydrolase)
MPRSLKELQRIVGDFQRDRPIMQKADSPKHIIKLARVEIDEAEAEIGKPERLAGELADVAILLMTLANVYEIDLGEAIVTKVARNHLKYESRNFQEGDYTQKVIQSKRAWLASGGDEEFYK